ncbi:hypothetical protein [Oceanobacillus locisalsi]|uniref:Nudix hydrolase domain-containing protein n=1 Tax=Oceanobacillus locisalsi TaxID=546107 RepID=A0ABW3NCL6_9BACI
MRIKKMRMAIDFYKYLIFLNYRQSVELLINLTIFMISFISFLYNTLFTVAGEYNSGWLLFLIVLYSFFNIVWNLLEKWKEIQAFKGKNKDIIMKSKSILVKDDKAVQLSDIHAERRGEIQFENMELNRPRDNQQESVIYSKEINHYLWDRDFTIEKDTIKEKKIKQFIKKNREIITPFFQYKYYDSKKNNHFFFNESKLSMSSEINPKNDYINLCKSNYYHSYLTNEISTSTLQRVEDATIIYDASNFYPCEHKKLDKENDITYLQPMDKCEMSNHIGISTLAVTRDNNLVIRKQGINTQQNKNQYVPTGSGSADWSDIKNNSLHDTLIHAMNRELWEENGGKSLKVPMNKFGDTKVLGYFRWLRRGGKPEFAGITKLHVSMNQLTPDNSEFIDITNKADTDTFYLNSVDDVPEKIKQIQEMENLSIPLQMCLVFVLDYYEECREELEEFLGL